MSVDHRIVDRAELPADADELARTLIGMVVVRDASDPQDERCVARIVETEAYVPGDAAGHAFIGKTARNASLFLERGHAYVYFIYGMYFCFNVSAGSAEVGAGVLIRAAEPLAGIATMQRRRGTSVERDLLRGPGRFAIALDIDRSLDGADLCSSGANRHRGIALAVDAASSASRDIACSTRIGLTKEAHRPLRYFVRDNVFVSGPRQLNAMR